jgi:hypothetical protein
MKPEDAYRAGYEKGRKDNIVDNVGEAFSDMMRDDPGGYYGVGYRDGAALRKFNPHGDKESKPPSQKSAAVSLPSSLESQWYAICDGSEFISKETVDRWLTSLYAAGSHVAAMIGLNNFTGHICPRCSAPGHFKIHFLGSLNHPECGWSGYMKTGSYIGHQIAQIFHTGVRAGGALKEEADKKPERSGNWIYAIFGFLVVAVFRAAAAVVLIPLHTVVALFQSGQAPTDVATRVITLAIMIAAIGIGVYEIRSASTPRSQYSSGGSISGTSTLKSQHPPGLILGTWKADSELITFMPDGTYVDKTPGRRFSGTYSLSSSTLVMTFPELRMTAQIVSLDAWILKYRKVNVTQFDGTAAPYDSAIHTMVRLHTVKRKTIR